MPSDVQEKAAEQERSLVNDHSQRIVSLVNDHSQTVCPQCGHFSGDDWDRCPPCIACPMRSGYAAWARSRMAAAYRNAVRDTEEVAQALREHVLVPFCRKHGYVFTSGMGEWQFDRAPGLEDDGRCEAMASHIADPTNYAWLWEGEDGPDVPWPQDHLDIMALLRESSDITKGYDLGSWIQDVTEEDLKDPRRPTS